MYNDKVGDKGEREGVRKAEREGRRVGGRKAHVTLNGNALGCNMYCNNVLLDVQNAHSK